LRQHASGRKDRDATVLRFPARKAGATSG
jgi:hypothetical protein